eukprot:TRINITY_DN2656_c0_g1_i1.p1 TRINITY_DN2656_c0_g1~~TRINITY_DN2656_c0_g1_i1.p1  ORF type:complete len:207 (-),score=42.50 TRINITY_DN2656_c0_g1_i1:187-807(-)
MRVATPLYPKFLDQKPIPPPPQKIKQSQSLSSSSLNKPPLSPTSPTLQPQSQDDIKETKHPLDSPPSLSQSTTPSSLQFSRVTTGAKWEPIVGYCRALRAGNTIYISGTAPINPDGSTTSPGDAYLQTKRCLEIIQESLKELGADMSNVVRTRMFVTDIKRWEEYGKAHSEVFNTPEKRPVTSMLEVKALINPDMLIEIEAEAVVL